MKEIKMIQQHHTKYKEIDGEDEIINLSGSEHRKLHIQLKRSPIPANVIWRAYRRSPKGRKQAVNYRTKNIKHIMFSNHISKGINLIEDINFNIITGNFWYVSYFDIDKRYANGCGGF